MVLPPIGADGLWVHQASAVIAADSHDIWEFTPEFLMSNGLALPDWECIRATRNPDDVFIQYESNQYGLIHWRIDEHNLWITSRPDYPFDLEVQFNADHIIPVLSRRYLDSVPFLPARQIWFFWDISAIVSDPHSWMRNNFLNHGWTAEFEYASVQPELIFYVDNTQFSIRVRPERSHRQGEPFDRSITFECYATNQDVRRPSELIGECWQWGTRLVVLRRIINHLLLGGGPS